MTEVELTSGQVLGRYELLMPIAKGGMARVWAARLLGTRGFRKMVAVKTILRGVIDDTRLERMFLEEASLASQIHHPNVVQTLELGEHDGTLYLAMEWVDGEPLHLILAHAQEHGGLPLSIAVNIVGQACKGLHAAHELRDENGALVGLVHRDISPQNVLVTFSGTTKLVDFGIAKATSRVASLTEAGELKGKFAYMSPEQVTGSSIDRRADIFSIGVLLYMLTTNHHPFKGAHPGETVRNICSDKPALPPSQLVENYPPALEAVVLKALHKEPEQRWATALDLLSALEEALPEYLEGSFETEVSRYLGQILGQRMEERRRMLRLTEARHDGLRINSSGSLSAVGVPSSLGAITVDRTTTSLSHEPPQITVGETPISSRPVPPSRTRRVVAIAAVPIVLGAGILLGSRGISPLPDAAGSANAATAAPALAPSLPTAASASQAKKPPEREAEPVLDSPEKAEAAPAQHSASPAKNRRVVRQLPGAAPPKVPAASPATAPEPAASVNVPAVPPAPARPAERASDSRKPNAWDPATFGGRH